MRKKLAVDQDQVLADLTSAWIERYNRDYNDILTVEDVTEWELENLVKPECGKKIYTYLDDQELFLNLPVIRGSQEVLEKLSFHFDIHIVTAVRNLKNIEPKSEWLKKHFPFIPEERYVFTRDKSIVYADWLIDDKPKNLEGFQGMRLLFDALHNRQENRFIRMKDWYEIEKFFRWRTGIHL
jgi:5'(3')-deoxyribonucleotidase